MLVFLLLAAVALGRIRRLSGRRLLLTLLLLLKL